MSRSLLYQELIFSGNASDQNSAAYVPRSLTGQYVEFTVYIQFSSGAAAGKIQIETSFPPEGSNKPVDNPPMYTGTWAAVGSTIDWAAQSTQKYASVTGVFADLRLRIDTAVTTGTVRAFIVAASHAP